MLRRDHLHILVGHSAVSLIARSAPQASASAAEPIFGDAGDQDIDLHL